MTSSAATLRLAILTICRDSLVRETVLQTTLAQELPTAPLLSELRAALAELETERMLTSIRPQLGGPPKYLATDLGRAALQQ